MRESEKLNEYLTREASREHWDRIHRGKRVALDLLQHAIGKAPCVSGVLFLLDAIEHVEESK